MGFPVGYTEVFLPKLLLNGLSFLGFIRTLISSFFLSLGLSDFLLDSPDSHRFDPLLDIPIRIPDSPPMSAVLIREFLPVQYQGPSSDPPESCAVCLYELEVGDEIRELRNCRHVFHRSCLDRWLDCEQKTCPLCRTQFVPDCMQDEFHQRLWAASGIVGADFYSDYASL
ncbi:hypothetical protein MLD38_019780 [Melastoma candidum]|uniref:Uncharacterized protein n=1 Tax=Melastoma candidum TaxID=119954 RepID=A0ACB9QZX8_9MYRT|nr:hypothetical protein MLD38_019780 [Melastoma candidum]